MSFINSQQFQHSLKTLSGQEHDLLKDFTSFLLLPGISLETIICSDHPQIHNTRCLDPSDETGVFLFNESFSEGTEVNGNHPKP